MRRCGSRFPNRILFCNKIISADLSTALILGICRFLYSRRKRRTDDFTMSIEELVVCAVL